MGIEIKKLINNTLKNFFITFLFLTFNQLPLNCLAEQSNLEFKKNLNNIDKGYLKTLLENFYILSPRDSLELIVSEEYNGDNLIIIINSKFSVTNEVITELTAPFQVLLNNFAIREALDG